MTIKMKFWAFWYIVCLVLENVAAKAGETWETDTKVIARKTRWEISVCGTQITHTKWQPASRALGWWVISLEPIKAWQVSCLTFDHKKTINSQVKSLSLSCSPLLPQASCWFFFIITFSSSYSIEETPKLHNFHFNRRNLILRSLLNSWTPKLQLRTLYSR